MVTREGCISYHAQNPSINIEETSVSIQTTNVYNAIVVIGDGLMIHDPDKGPSMFEYQRANFTTSPILD